MRLPWLHADSLREANLIIAGGVESMSRAPYVMGKSDSAFGRSQKIEDTTMGWRFINPKLERNVWCRHHAADCGERGSAI